MEELVSEVAELLGISVQEAINIYPMLRSQYIWYNILSGVVGWSILLVFILAFVIFISYTIRRDTDKHDWRSNEVTEEWIKIDKLFKIELSIFVLLVVIGIVGAMAIPFLAPDVIVIESLIG